MKKILSDFSSGSISAGLTTVLVGYASSVVIVFQAAKNLNATDAQLGSWLLALGLGMGIPGIWLSLRYRMPVSVAWSTSGAALIGATSTNISMSDAVGAFLASAVLILLCGYTGVFERVIKYIPGSIASGMLAGILLSFGLNTFTLMDESPWLVGVMFVSYLLGRRLMPRYAVAVSLLIGIILSQIVGHTFLTNINYSIAMPVYIEPSFSWASIMGIGLPLFFVTMASQNLPGYTVVKNAGYDLPLSPAIGIIGLTNSILAVFGAYALNLATLTAAICVSPEAHPDKEKRYTAGVAAGIFYIMSGLFGAAIAAILTQLPQSLILGIAGIALFSTIANSLGAALADTKHREVAVITFLATGSGVEFIGLGSGLWGLIIGLVTHVILNGRVINLRRKNNVNKSAHQLIERAE